MCEEMGGEFLKAVVDIDKEIISIGAELHSDEEAQLLDEGSGQQNLWGINIYPDKEGEQRIEFDSMINIRPKQGNRTRGVNDPETKKKIIEVVNNLIR